MGDQGEVLPPRRLQLILASNRAPLSTERDADGKLRHVVGSGGLATALWAVSRGSDCLYVATSADAGTRPGTAAFPNVVQTDHGPLRMVSVRPEPEQFQLYYNTIANPYLWFVQHNLYPTAAAVPDRSQLLYAWREGYLPVNRAFAQAIVDGVTAAKEQPVVMLQDYHLYCVAPLVRRQRPDAVVTQFVHIPWPDEAVWRSLVPREILDQIVQGLCANDVVGFQTERDAQNFINTAISVAGAVVSAGDTLHFRGHKTRVRSYPISIDVGERLALRGTPGVAHERELLAEQVPAEKLLLFSVGRGDVSKNLEGVLLAFDHLLDSKPELKGRVKFLVLANPTREQVDEYIQYRERVDQLVKRIVARHGDLARPDAGPLAFEWITEDMARAAAAMERADAIVVASLADGMNLVAKDSVVLNDHAGALILSETCGAFEELGEWAITVSDPRDIGELANAMYRALTMPSAEKWARLQQMKLQIAGHDINRWRDLQLADVHAVLRERERLKAPGAKSL